LFDGGRFVADVAEQEIDRTREFASALGLGVVDWTPEDFADGALTLPFGLSAWMRQCAVDPDEACAAIWLLRDALVEVSGLHRATEPRPLMPADRKTAVLNMTVYLDSLVGRASRCAGSGRVQVLEAAVGRLRS
jgi:hypothetical protein